MQQIGCRVLKNPMAAGCFRDDRSAYRETLALHIFSQAYPSSIAFLSLDRASPYELRDRRGPNAGHDRSGPTKSSGSLRRTHSDHPDHGLPDQAVRARTMKNGVKGYLAKPFDGSGARRPRICVGDDN
jgi:hypothetical protein